MLKLFIRDKRGQSVRAFAVMLALTVMLALSLAACGGGGSGGNSEIGDADNSAPVQAESSEDEGELDKALLLPDGQAWIEDGTTEMTAGYIFAEDGTYGFYWYTWGEEEWGEPGEEGTWITNDGDLTITNDTGTQQLTYKISGSKLTITDKYVKEDSVTYTKQDIPYNN
jgi:predicted small lipoprotein YifL